MKGDSELVRRLERLEGGVQREQRSNFIEVGKLLGEILDNQLYVAKGYRNFVKYVDDDRGLKFTGKHAVRLVRTYRFIQSLPEGVCLPTSERQVRPLIKLGFDEARMVWMEAQNISARDGKAVTGELVSEIVSQLENSYPGTLGRSRQKSLSRAGSSAYTTTHLSPLLAAGLENSVSQSRQPPFVDANQLLTEFEHLKAKVKALPVRDKEFVFRQWKNSLDSELQTLTAEDMSASHTDETSRKRSKDEIWSGSDAGEMTHCGIQSEESNSSGNEGLTYFSCKRRRSGSRKPRTNMSRFAQAKCQCDDHIGQIKQERLNMHQTNEDDKNKANCRGLGLLWSAVELVSN